MKKEIGYIGLESMENFGGVIDFDLMRSRGDSNSRGVLKPLRL